MAEVRSSLGRVVIAGLGVMALGAGCRTVIGIEEKRYVNDGGAGAGGQSGAATGGGGSGAGAPCSADVLEDPANCGACGHDCLGGECVEGACQPVEFAVGGTPQGLAADSERVYWADRDVGKIRSLRRDMTDARVLVAIPGTLEPTRLTLFGGTLFFSVYNPFEQSVDGPGYIGRVQTDGAAIGTLAVASGGPWAVATDGADVYFTTRWWEPTLAVVPAGGGEAQAIQHYSGEPEEIWTVLLDGPYVYYTAATSQTLNRRTKSGPREILRSAQRDIIALAIDGDDLIWSANDAIWRAPKSNPEEATLLVPIYARALAVAGEHLHFCDGHRWERVGKDGTGRETVLDDLVLTDNFAVTEEAVYLADQLGGTIWRVAR